MFRDRVYETSISNGTASFTLAGAVPGHRSFSSAFATATAYYCIVNRDNPDQWEIGSFTVSGSTLARSAANVLSGSSGAGTLVNFSAGTKDVHNAPPALSWNSWHTGRLNNVSGGITAASRYAIVSTSLTKAGSDLILNAATGACFPTANCNCALNCACACRC